MGLKKKKSKIHGVGVFTDRQIKKGTDFYKIPLKTIYKRTRPRCARIAPKKYVFDNKVLNWVNHSCNPNSKINLKSVSLAAIKTIKKGEEITVDYLKTEVEGKKVKCNCKAKKCRGFLLK